MNPANKATLLRILLVPVFVACFYINSFIAHLIACAIFVFASLTDVWDGWYARKHDLVTDFGKLMDPMADKLLFCTAYIMLCSVGKVSGILCSTGRVSGLLTVIFVARELIISAFRLIAVEKGVVIAAGKLGKLKTLLQCFSIVLLLLDNPLFRLIGVPMDQIVTYLAALFTVWSCVDYIIKNRNLVSTK